MRVRGCTRTIVVVVVIVVITACRRAMIVKSGHERLGLLYKRDTL